MCALVVLFVVVMSAPTQKQNAAVSSDGGYDLESAEAKISTVLKRVLRKSLRRPDKALKKVFTAIDGISAEFDDYDY